MWKVCRPHATTIVILVVPVINNIFQSSYILLFPDRRIKIKPMTIFKDDHRQAFGCLPLQVISIVIALVTGSLAIYIGYTAFFPLDWTDTRSIGRILTCMSFSLEFVLALLVLTLCLPVTCRFLLYGAISAVSSAVFDVGHAAPICHSISFAVPVFICVNGASFCRGLGSRVANSS